MRRQLRQACRNLRRNSRNAPPATSIANWRSTRWAVPLLPPYRPVPAHDGEIDPRPLLREAQRRGKATYLPVLGAGRAPK